MTLEELIRIYGSSPQTVGGARQGVGIQQGMRPQALPPVNPMPRRQFTEHGMMPLGGRHGSFPLYGIPSGLGYQFRNPGLLGHGVRVTPLPDDAPVSGISANLRDSGRQGDVSIQRDYRRAIDPATVREGDVAMMRRATQGYGTGFGNEIDWGTLREGDVEKMRRIVSEWDRKKLKK